MYHIINQLSLQESSTNTLYPQLRVYVIECQCLLRKIERLSDHYAIILSLSFEVVWGN